MCTTDEVRDLHCTNSIDAAVRDKARLLHAEMSVCKDKT